MRSKDNLSRINAKIAEALVALKALRSWVNEPLWDARTEKNIREWLSKAVTRVETIDYLITNSGGNEWK
jgi:hypothetical protein